MDRLSRNDHRWEVVFPDQGSPLGLYQIQGNFLMKNAAVHNLRTVYDKAKRRQDPEHADDPLPVDQAEVDAYFQYRRN
jgi:hypothetical protein